LELDRAVYAWADTVTARLTIRDGNGSVVYLWSRGRVFPQIVSELEIPDQKEFTLSVPLGKLSRGSYVVQGWFTTDGPARAYSASARFQIQ
jgi:hypothetical protein